MGLILVGALACSDVHFVPSPYTPQNVEVVYSAQEDITIIRWRVSASPPLGDTTFQLLGSNGYESIDFSHSVFPGGVIACGDGAGACAQYVVRGSYAFAEDAHPVQAVHPSYGALPGATPTQQMLAQTLAIQSFFHPHNDTVYVNMSDAVATNGPYLFPRRYDRAMWATSGLCLSNSPPSGVSFSPLDETGGFAPEPPPLTELGTYCVALRPVPADGGAAAVVETRIATVPEVVTRHQVFEPPIEQAPIIYQIVLDLQIPIPDRCASAIQTIEAQVGRYFQGGGVPVRKLPTINLANGMLAPDDAPGCAQVNNRRVDAAELAQAAKDAVASFPEVYQQFHFLYFNNLDAPLPSTLSQSLQALFDALFVPPPGHQLETFSWLFNPGEAVISDVNVNWWTKSNWLAADDPSFEQTLAMYALPTFPYKTQTHDPYQPVALLNADETAQRAGQIIKICNASPGIQPISTKTQELIVGSTWTIAGDDPPAYLVGLPMQIAVAASAFVEAKSIVDYQICTRYCADHPYVTDAGTGVTSWADSSLCASQDY